MTDKSESWHIKECALTPPPDLHTCTTLEQVGRKLRADYPNGDISCGGNFVLMYRRNEAEERIVIFLAEEGPPPPDLWIRRQWNDWRIAKVSFDNLEDPHWDTFSGGVFQEAPQPFIHGYVWCCDVQGEIAHSCAHGEGPHRIKVCVVKKDNDPKVFDELLDWVGPKPRKRRK